MSNIGSDLPDSEKGSEERKLEFNRKKDTYNLFKGIKEALNPSLKKSVFFLRGYFL